jgi:ribosomal protein L37AE/L43A
MVSGNVTHLVNFALIPNSVPAARIVSQFLSSSVPQFLSSSVPQFLSNSATCAPQCGALLFRRGQAKVWRCHTRKCECRVHNHLYFRCLTRAHTVAARPQVGRGESLPSERTGGVERDVQGSSGSGYCWAGFQRTLQDQPASTGYRGWPGETAQTEGGLLPCAVSLPA